MVKQISFLYSRFDTKNKFIYPLVIFLAWCGGSWHWLSGKSFIPWDSIDAFFPQVAFVINALSRGESPTWNPLIFGGIPALGDPQGMIFTPHVLTGFLSGSAFGLWVFDITTLACMLAGALCLYCYARSHGSACAYAALGAIVFLLGGYGTSRLQHVPQIISYALLPILLLTFRSNVIKPSFWSVLALSIVGLLLVLNPNHLVFLIPFLLGPLMLFELLQSPRKTSAISSITISALLVMLLAAPSVSAILETVAHSTRATISLQNNAPASLPSFSVLSLFIPGLFLRGPGNQGYWGPADLTESYLYIGIIPAFVAFIGLARRESPSPILLLSWLMGIFAFLYAMGTHGLIFPWLFDNIPGFSFFRRPSDGAYYLTLYFSLAVALVSAPGSGRLRSLPERFLMPAVILIMLLFCFIGLINYATQLGKADSLISASAQYAMRFIIVATVIIIIWIFFPNKQRSTSFLIAVFLLTIIDLATTGRGSKFAGQYKDYGFAGMFRVLNSWRNNSSMDAISMRALSAIHSGKDRVEIIGTDNAPMALGIPMTQGYNPMKLSRYQEVFGAQLLSREPKKFSSLAPSITSEAYRWLGLRFLLIHSEILDNPKKFGAINKNALELRNAVLASGGREIETEGSYRLIEIYNLYPRGSVVIDREEETMIPKLQCQIISETTTSGIYFCDLQASGKLVIGDSFAPGWMACVNGIAVPIKPFIHALRSVSVPAGKSFVEFQYQSVPLFRWLEKCSKYSDLEFSLKSKSNKQ